MADELKFPEPGSRKADKDALDPRLAAVIRSAYAPPVDPADADRYWAGLEQRVMARVTSSDAVESSRYWGVLGRWAQTGLIAAVALFAVAGIVNSRIVDSVDSDDQYAYEDVVRSTAPESVSATTDLMSSTDAASARDATLRYVLSQ